MEWELETRKAGVERTLTAVLRGPVTAGLVARDAAISLSGWAAEAMRTLHDRLSEGLDEARETGRSTIAELRAAPEVSTDRLGRGEEGFSGSRGARPPDNQFATRTVAPARPASVPAPGTKAGEATRNAAPRRKSTDGAASPPPPDSITDYDQLSALQVIQRLDGLAAPELDEVRAYETARRGRRTILAKIDQLQRSA